MPRTPIPIFGPCARRSTFRSSVKWRPTRCSIITSVLSVQSLTKSTDIPQRGFNTGHVKVLVHLPDRGKCATLKRSRICRIRSRDAHSVGRALRSLAIDPAPAAAAVRPAPPISVASAGPLCDPRIQKETKAPAHTRDHMWHSGADSSLGALGKAQRREHLKIGKLTTPRDR
jgi:hypothetical protein